jgi:hypothetical protein
MAYHLLAASGRDLYTLKGGTAAWLRTGNPDVRCTVARWALERQVRFVAGLLVAVGVLLAVTWSRLWLILPGFIGCGLTFAGLTDFCPMGELLARLPWNRQCLKTAQPKPELPAGITCSCQLPRQQ